MALGRPERELDGFDGFPTIIPADINSAEHDSLLELWARLDGRRWRRGEKWRYADACEWEGVAVRGGEQAARVPEARLAKVPDPETGLMPEEPEVRRRGDPRFEVDEEVLVRSRLPGRAGGLEGWREGDALRPARVLFVAIRGRGVKLEVEYDLRYLDGFVVGLDMAHNKVAGSLPPSGLLRSFPHLRTLRLQSNALQGPIDVEILVQKVRGLMEVSLQDNAPGFSLPGDFARIAEPPESLPDGGPRDFLEAAAAADAAAGLGLGGGSGGSGGGGSSQASRRVSLVASAGEAKAGEAKAESEAPADDGAALVTDSEVASLAARLAAPLGQLDLSRCSLVGPLDLPQLASLTSLTELSLDDNALSGPLPAESLTCLRNLEVLSVERNRVTGKLPALLCKMSGSLRILRLGANSLEGPIPPEWGWLDRLEELGLGGNPGIDPLRDGWLAELLPNCLLTF